jgi:hypothetical protein
MAGVRNLFLAPRLYGVSGQPLQGLGCLRGETNDCSPRFV